MSERFGNNPKIILKKNVEQPNEERMMKLEQSTATGVKVVKQRHKTE
jgi:hypothetical protein